MDRELWCEAIQHVAFLVDEASQNGHLDDSNNIFDDQNMASKLHISTINSTSRGRKIVSF